MRRVTKPDGRVAVTVWDIAGGRAPVSVIWRAVARAGIAAPGEASLPGAHDGDLVQYFTAAGYRSVEPTALTVMSRYDTYDEWWQANLHGVGPVGDFIGQLNDADRERVRMAGMNELGEGPFSIEATAWAARATA